MKHIFSWMMLFSSIAVNAQEKVMTKELLWELGRVNGIGVSEDGTKVYYAVGKPNMKENKIETSFFQLDLKNNQVQQVKEISNQIKNKNISPNGKYTLSHESVKVKQVLGKDYYPEMSSSNAYVYDGLDYRHWDTDNDGTFKHVILTNNKTGEKIDLLEGEPFNSPQKPFGGDEDYVWSPDGTKVVYVSKKKEGTAYALSTNTDLYEYDVEQKTAKNLTEKNLGYDTHPSFNSKGFLAYLQMKRDGYEADKNDIIVRIGIKKYNLTEKWDGTVSSFTWNKKGDKIYFLAPIDGTNQLFEVTFDPAKKKNPIKQLTKGDFDVTNIVGFSEDKVLVTRTDFNTAAEIYSFDLKKSKWQKLTSVNDALYKDIAKSKVEKKYITTTDGKKMLTWVILPPNFDANKKYPTLLYCQGGPQSIVSPFYSFRWNFQLMAAEGYVIVAPNRRGLPGFGVEWNEAISKDWAGQPMKDYLTAIDEVSKESYVDTNRRGAIGASYGGYSVYYLAGIHQNRFKSLIAHCGVFNLESMYGTTEEVFFSNFDFGGAYWEKDNTVAQKTFREFNPIHNVDKWNTPILVIHGGKDYRVPIGQGQEAFQAAQLRGIKSRFLYLPDENHWVLKPQNGMIWQGEFFRWLKETL